MSSHKHLTAATQWSPAFRLPSKPSETALITEMLAVEHQVRSRKNLWQFQQLLGQWQLTFVTRGAPARHAQQSPKGQWLPEWAQIYLSFSASCDDWPESDANSSKFKGRVQNIVRLGPLQLRLSGPTLFYQPLNILAFDFTDLEIWLFKNRIFNLPIRGGDAQAQAFYSQPLKEQAFFRFFWVTPEGIAARGKGGGLALWSQTANRVQTYP